jgi:hypothetical protein
MPFSTNRSVEYAIDFKNAKVMKKALLQIMGALEIENILEHVTCVYSQCDEIDRPRFMAVT